MAVAPSYNAYARFHVDGLLLLHDSVNVSNCAYEVTPDGFSVEFKGTTLAGSTGTDPIVELVKAAVSAVANGKFIRASVTGDQLALTVGEFRIVYVRVAPLSPQPPPSG
jgi:hypothetical protein